jgi:5-(carboxyamino)imidazole ribonucleotide mutase
MSHPLVSIIMGSDSDLSVMKECALVLEEFSIEYEVVVSSAHRVPEGTAAYAKEAASRGVEVIVAGAGVAAHLAGVIAAHTPLPVIGVPIQSGALQGLDSLYSIVQMPAGIPVATVAINGARNAGILAAQILGVKDPQVREKILEFKQKMTEKVVSKNAKLQEKGWRKYLEEQG